MAVISGRNRSASPQSSQPLRPVETSSKCAIAPKRIIPFLADTNAGIVVLPSPWIGIRSRCSGNIWSDYAGFIEGAARRGHGLPVFTFLTEFSHLPIRSHQRERTEMPVLHIEPGRAATMLTCMTGHRHPGKVPRENKKMPKRIFTCDVCVLVIAFVASATNLWAQDGQGYAPGYSAADPTRRPEIGKPAARAAAGRTKTGRRIRLPTTVPCRRRSSHYDADLAKRVADLEKAVGRLRQSGRRGQVPAADQAVDCPQRANPVRCGELQPKRRQRHAIRQRPKYRGLSPRTTCSLGRI